jgi:ADP-heptose:LPS heptosyltransferase
MSNILIIKHGSLGDIAQISGVIRDIRETYNKEKIFILTTFPYVELLSRCPYVDGVLIDKRLPRWNILYLLKLRKMIKKFNFSYVYDLQNSSRTFFYRRYLFK